MLPKESTWENLPKNSIDLAGQQIVAVADCGYNFTVLCTSSKDAFKLSDWWVSQRKLSSPTHTNPLFLLS